MPARVTSLVPVRVASVSSLPGSGSEGDVVELTTDHSLYFWNGTGWVALMLTGSAPLKMSRGTVAPTSPATGDLWVDESTSGTVGITEAAADAAYMPLGQDNLALDLNGASPPNPPGLSLTKVGRVLEPGSAGTFDAALVESPCIFWDPVSSRWAMVYVGYTQTSGRNGGITAAVVGSLGLAFSTDLITWTKDSQFLAPSGSGADSAGVSGAKVVYDGSLYHIYYIGMTATGYEAGTKSLCYATKTSLTGAATRYGAIVSPSGSGWRQSAVYVCSTPVLVGSTYHMFINAAASGAANETIGHATASSLAGPWTVDDANSPVLNVGSGGSWDEHIVGDPGVFREGGHWWMSYYGANSGAAAASDGWAFTTDDAFPYGWTKYTGNPILPAGVSGEFDDAFAHKPFILRTQGRHYHYYTADDGTARSIGLAVDSPPLGVRARFKTSAVTTNYTFNTASWSELDSGLRLPIAAAAGDLLEFGMSGVWDTQAVDGYLDVKMVTSANYASENGSTTTGYGAGAWYGASGRYEQLGGSVFYKVVSGDIASGMVLATPVIKTGGSKTLFSNGGTKYHWWVRNHGREMT